jgi:hypothetical protein
MPKGPRNPCISRPRLQRWLSPTMEGSSRQQQRKLATGIEMGHLSSNRNLSSFSSGTRLNRLSFVSKTELLALSLDKDRYGFLQIFDVTTGTSRGLSLHLHADPNLSRDGLALATDGSLIGYWCKADRDKLRKLMARLSPDKFTEHTSLVVSMWKEKVEY